MNLTETLLAIKESNLSRGMERIICKQCSVEFYRYASRKRQFCGRKCFSDYRAYLFEKDGYVRFSWKGDKAGYHALHKWIVARKGRPKVCEHCRTTEAKRYEWANKSWAYKREFDDWMRLCSSCHKKYDHAKRYGIKNGEKRCSSCKEIKPIISYSRNRKEADGMQSACKSCERVRSLNRKRTTV